MKPSYIPDRPELLAPAGGPGALRAAVAQGADAVYLGLDRLNARRGAENFTLETLADACRFAHIRGVRVYLTANVLVLPSEIEDALSLLDAAWGTGVDAVILQDLGLVRIIREALPHIRVHASTQLNAHSSSTVEALAGRGVSRVTLARETSLEEISTLAAVARTAGIEAESFVHGAICVCYSGQCLLSSLIGGRSANRGMCAQPCRLPYELIDEAGRILGAPGPYLLSPKDLAGISALAALCETGVAALKIEGRMKSAEYVALVTGVYRAALDRAVTQAADYEARAGEMSVLEEAFSRGLTPAYLDRVRGNEMMSYRRPNNRGVLVGRIATLEGDAATIAFEASADAEDTIEVWTARGRFAQAVGPLSYNGATHRSVPAGTRATITVSGAAAAGDRVFRVRNAALVAAAERSIADAEAGHLDLNVSVRLVVDEALRVEVSDSEGRSGAGTGAVVERARTKAITVDEVKEHVGRFGGTAFRPGAWDVALSPDAGIGYSALHRARRDAIQAYEERLLGPWKKRATVNPALPHLPRPYRYADPVPRLVAAVADLSVARACLQAGCESVHVPVWALSGETPPDGVVPALPRICHDSETEGDLRYATHGARVVASTLGQVDFARRRGAIIESHWSLNVLNPYSAAELCEMGASFVWLSPELSSRQVAEIARESPVPVGVAVVGRQELMVTEHCILMSEGDCAERCESCKRRTGWRFLRDRKGYSFPVRTDLTGRTHVFNAVPLDLTSALPELLSTGVAGLRLDLETEKADSAAATVARVRTAIRDVVAGREPSTTDRAGTTSGHFFRGVK